MKLKNWILACVFITIINLGYNLQYTNATGWLHYLGLLLGSGSVGVVMFLLFFKEEVK